MGISELIRIEPDKTIEPAARWRAEFEAQIEGISQVSPLAALGGELLSFSFSGACIYYVHSDVQRLVRQRPSPRNRFAPMAIIPLLGEIQVSQFDRQCLIEPGQFTLIDSAAPLSLVYEGEFRELCLLLPGSCFVPAAFHQAVCAETSGSTKFDEAFVSFLDTLWESADTLEAEDHGAALNSILSLMQLTTPLRRPATDSTPCVRVRRAMAFIEHHLAEEWLTPRAIADAQGVSRRYLDELFGKMNLRVERWIWERRLIRARDELKLSARARKGCRKSIIQVALDSGFKSPSHFSRAFSSRFGVSPREFRQGVMPEMIGQP